MKKVCVKCGSSNIQVLAWVNPNTLEITDWDDNEPLVICNDCESQSNEWVDVEE